MKVTEQIDALEATAVDSFKYLVVTRMVACVVALPILTTVMNAAGIFGGYLAEASIAQTSPQLYFDRAFSWSTLPTWFRRPSRPRSSASSSRLCRPFSG